MMITEGPDFYDSFPDDPFDILPDFHEEGISLDMAYDKILEEVDNDNELNVMLFWATAAILCVQDIDKKFSDFGEAASILMMENNIIVGNLYHGSDEPVFDNQEVPIKMIFDWTDSLILPVHISYPSVCNGRFPDIPEESVKNLEMFTAINPGVFAPEVEQCCLYASEDLIEVAVSEPVEAMEQIIAGLASSMFDLYRGNIKIGDREKIVDTVKRRFRRTMVEDENEDALTAEYTEDEAIFDRFITMIKTITNSRLN